MDHACVDEETFLEDVILYDQGQIFLYHTAPPQLLVESLFHETTANLVDWLAVPLFQPLAMAEQ